MIDIRPPAFEWGQPVLAAVDLYNDGSHPEVPEDALLIPAGGLGEIVQIGHHSEANIPVYMVDFGLTVIGCLEEELTRQPAAPLAQLMPVPRSLGAGAGA